MFSGQVTQAILRGLDSLGERGRARSEVPPHLLIGRRGEEAAYFHLRRHGYTMVARNFRSPRRRGEIDLIGWDGDVLCFIEVKSRTSHDVKPAEAAVNHAKRKELAAVAREYRRGLPTFGQWRFDIVTVYYEDESGRPQIEVFKNAFSVS